MNYIKKIQTIGFRRVKNPLIMREDYHYIKGKMYEAYIIEDALKWYNKVESTKTNGFSKKSALYLQKMKFTLSKDIIDQMQTYRWKVSNQFDIYLTIIGQSYICFGQDKEGKIKEERNTVIDETVFIIQDGVFNELFWKNIINSLDIKYKREIILNQII